VPLCKLDESHTVHRGFMVVCFIESARRTDLFCRCLMARPGHRQQPGEKAAEQS